MGFVMFTGGARSGKSSLALRCAAACAVPVVFVATGEAFDDEMRHRISLHQAERPPEWVTVEEPRELLSAVEAVPADSCVVVDCLSLWVSNLMFCDVEPAVIEARAAEVAGVLALRSGPGVVVTNEVGSGIVPDNALARGYRDVLGRVNATFSLRADDAYLAVMGRVIRLERFP